MEKLSSASGYCPMSGHTSDVLPRSAVHPDEIEKIPDKPLDRRTLLKIGGIGVTATTMASVSSLAWMPKRVARAMPATTPSDIQFDISAFVHPATTVNGIQVQFGVTYTFLAPAALTRNPTKADQTTLSNALATVESTYPFSPSGIFVSLAYGLPYFRRLPQSLVTSHMPLRSDGSGKPVLEEAVPSPTDVSSKNPNVKKATFNVPVQIEKNDVLFILRSDSLSIIADVSAWFSGSNSLNGNSVASPNFNGLFSFATPRLNFVQPGLPRQVANTLNSQGTAPFTTFTSEVNPASSMWMGFVDQQTNASAPSAKNVTFAGTGPNSSGTGAAHLTNAKAGDYFDNGSIIHTAHTLLDLVQFYNKDPNKFTGAEPFSERVQYMFSSYDPNGKTGLLFPEDPNDAFTNGGGQGAPTGSLSVQQKSAFLPNKFMGTEAQDGNFDPAALPNKVYRVGHTTGLQRSSRASDGTPLHIRIDGPGISSLDVPDGSNQPTLEFAVFVPTAEFFRVMRINSASLDYVATDEGGTGTSVHSGTTGSAAEDDGLERFLTATRRQNWLIPPRRHRSFPLLELT